MKADIGDVELFFDVEGLEYVAGGDHLIRRPTILLLHGGPGFDHAQLKPEFSALADCARLIYLDHRGHGRSGRGAPQRWNLAQWGQDVHRFCVTVGIEQPIIYGVSFGGFVAQSFAIQYPEALSGLILSSTSARLCIDRIYEAFERFGDARVANVARTFWLGDWSVVDEYIERCLPLYNPNPTDSTRRSRQIFSPEPAEHFGSAAGEALSFDYRSKLGVLTCRTLVIAGARDPVTTLSDARELSAAIPNGLVTLVIAEDCGHVVLWEKPEVELRAIRNFVELITRESNSCG